MITEVIKVNPNNIDLTKIKKAAEKIKDGGLIAFPTETVYGLGADAFNPKAVAKIFEAKKRPLEDPLIVHIAQRNDLYKLMVEGIKTTIPFHLKVLENPEFQKGEYSTKFIEEKMLEKE